MTANLQRCMSLILVSTIATKGPLSSEVTSPQYLHPVISSNSWQGPVLPCDIISYHHEVLSHTFSLPTFPSKAPFRVMSGPRMMYTCPLFFMHPSVDGPFSHFRVLAGDNSTAVNTGVQVSFRNRVLSRCMAPHSSALAWKIPWKEEPGGLQSMGSLRVRHD